VQVVDAGGRIQRVVAQHEGNFGFFPKLVQQIGASQLVVVDEDQIGLKFPKDAQVFGVGLALVGFLPVAAQFGGQGGVVVVPGVGTGGKKGLVVHRFQFQPIGFQPGNDGVNKRVLKRCEKEAFHVFAQPKSVPELSLAYGGTNLSLQKKSGMITSLAQLDRSRTYTYADYITWKIDQALELLRGKIRLMSAPNRQHQKLSWRLTVIFDNKFKNHPCEAYAAPFDVRLYDRKKSLKADRDIYTVVQPDLCLVCDLKKLDDRGCLGAPDLVVEILSPGNSAKEMRDKKGIYEEAGVREYWIVDPERATVTRFNLEAEARYGRPLIFVNDEQMPSEIFPDFELQLSELFPMPDEDMAVE
jgi:Uma2 family endonuclease